MKEGYRVLQGFRIIVAMATLALGLAVLSTDAKADLVIGAQSVSANAGSTGSSFEVYLTNTGTSSIDVAAFSFEISTANSNVSFTGATTSTTDPYIFAGNSLFGPGIGPVVDTVPGQSIDASDLNVVGSSTIDPGAIFGLGEISFDVAPGTTPGNYAVSFTSFPSTSFSDLAGDNLAFTTSDGSITVNGTSQVPEPSGLWLVASSVAGWLWKRRRMQ